MRVCSWRLTPQALSLFLSFYCLFGCDCWTTAVAIQEKSSLDRELYFSPASPRTAGRSFLKQVKVAVQQLASFVRSRGNEPEPVTPSWCSARDLWFPRY